MKKTAIAALFICITLPAVAGNFYVVGSAGQSDFDINKSPIDSALTSAGATNLSSNTDTKGSAYKLQLGYQINPYFGIEGGYIDLGKASYTASATQGNANVEWKAKGFNLSAVGTYPINDKFSIFGKVGTIRSKVDANASGTIVSVGALSASASANKWNLTYGAGAGYTLSKQFGIRVEYERFDKLGDSDKTGKSDVNLISAGIVYSF